MFADSWSLHRNCYTVEIFCIQDKKKTFVLNFSSVDFTICCSFCSIHMDVLCWDEKCCEKLFDSFTVRIQASSHSVIFIACWKTLYIARKQKKRASVQLTQLCFNGFCRQSVSAIRSQTQASTFAKALGIVMAIFLICYAIDIARLICYTFHCSKYIPWLVVNLQSLLFVFNSASNPIVYAFLKQDICRELKHLVKCFVH